MQVQLQGQGQTLARARETAPAQPRVKHPLMGRVLVQQKQRAFGVAQNQIGVGRLSQIGQRTHP